MHVAFCVNNFSCIKANDPLQEKTTICFPIDHLKKIKVWGLRGGVGVIHQKKMFAAWI